MHDFEPCIQGLVVQWNFRAIEKNKIEYGGLLKSWSAIDHHYILPTFENIARYEKTASPNNLLFLLWLNAWLMLVLILIWEEQVNEGETVFRQMVHISTSSYSKSQKNYFMTDIIPICVLIPSSVSWIDLWGRLNMYLNINIIMNKLMRGLVCV